MKTERKDTALLLIDVQHDFLDGGALGVSGSLDLLPAWTRLAALFPFRVATQDWHPPGHMSFASSHAGAGAYQVQMQDGFPQTLWPDHAVQGTHGAALHPGLLTFSWNAIIRKGTHADTDSYSGFFDNRQRYATGLDAFLKEHGIKRLLVAGLATDYCVRFTVTDACRLGYETAVAVWACRAVDLKPGDGEEALREMEKAGARLLKEEELAEW